MAGWQRRSVAVHQFVPSLAPRDAIGDHVLALQELLRGLGYRSEIFADEVKPELAGRATRYRRWRAARSPAERDLTWVLYHGSIGSPVADFLARQPVRRLVYFHNVTPARLLYEWDPDAAQASRSGTVQLRALAQGTTAAFANSAFSAEDARRMGYRRTFVVPPLLGGRDVEPDPVTTEKLAAAKQAGGAELLFVGRVSPHKAQHDLVKMLAVFRRLFDPAARLRLVGSALFLSYREALEAYAGSLGLAGAVEITGAVSDEVREAYYRSADVFVCASRHEGFCVPLVEAMARGLPVVAYGGSAVAETAASAGIVLEERAPEAMAAAVGMVLGRADLRREMAAAGARRAGELGAAASRGHMAAVISSVVDAAPAGGARRRIGR